MLGGIVAGGAARWFSGNRKDGAADRQAGPEPSGLCTSQSATLTICSVVNALVGGDRENDVVILEAQRLGKADESLLQFSGQPLGSSCNQDCQRAAAGHSISMTELANKPSDLLSVEVCREATP